MTTATTTVSNQSADLQRTIEALIDPGIIGLSVRVDDEQGTWVGSAGAAELGGSMKPPVDGHVRIGSNTKTFTATLVLQLVAEGRISLDDSVAHLLPEFGLDRRITVRMLLQQTSGLFNFTGEVYEDGSIVFGIPMPYGPNGTEWLNNRFTTYRPQELVELAVSKPARFEPDRAGAIPTPTTSWPVC
ncbi:serine hydrolase domain-containing protein [Agromyces sp. NPDC056965]|uniref:serine hydrolase domain-containing protein n=1 Tax=Agromyces sp. NPDC056965 TaxID=3345983 RepID=UPI00362F8145